METLTHPETAWLLRAAPALLAALITLTSTFVLRQPLARWLARLAQRRSPAALDPALVWRPTLLKPATALLIATGAAVFVSAALGFVGSLWLALAAAPAAAALVVRVSFALAAQRYNHQLERELTPAIGRLSALLGGGLGLRTAFERLLADMTAGPLQSEWSWLIRQQGAPLADSSIATMRQVIAALAAQTSAARHATLLNHLAVVADQPQDLQARRCAAVYAALQASERRREEALTELAQMRYSGLAVGGAGVLMAVYLIATQWERVRIAYSTPLGMVFAVIVGLALLAPIAGGIWFSRVEDVEY
ncbi:hypothetical protein [Chloroflexus sp.]|uniref:hypothetical protein n=1 Tax=Chloroflexus sp. TaxID=1904827 RepID=UPI002ACD7855|nr:hypothetical protein [Chloroflexus sp.]